MKMPVNIARVLVGILFVISGLIKLNDPVGFSFKLEEYFSPAVLNIDFLTPYALIIAIFIVIFETLLGIMLLLGFKPKFTVWSLLLMILFFTFLTGYSAYFNKVTDCGCFGDALKLTPWQSFTKDIVLLVLILILFFGWKHIKPLFSKGFAAFGTFLGLLASVGFVYVVLNHLPTVDFRAYKVGTNIIQGMTIPENAPQAVYEYDWKFNIGGKEELITTLGEYPEVEGEFLGVETREIQAGYEPPIHDFTIEKDGEDQAMQILEEPFLVMIISYDLLKADAEGLKKIKNISDIALEKGYRVIGMSASGENEAQEFKKAFALGFDFYFTDQTTLKTIVRSNPGVLLVKKGTIAQKLHFNDADKLNLAEIPETKVSQVDEKPTVNELLKHQLDSIYALDQGIRAIYKTGIRAEKDSIARASGIPVQEDPRKYFTLWAEIDSTNCELVENIMAQYGYPGKSLVGEPTNEAAWYVIQHNPFKIEKYLDTIKKAAEEGELPKRLAAMMEDRYLMEQNKAQRYGTQGKSQLVNGKMINFIWPIEDPEGVNERRKKAGFSQSVEAYGKSLFGEDFEYKILSLEEVEQ